MDNGDDSVDELQATILGNFTEVTGIDVYFCRIWSFIVQNRSDICYPSFDCLLHFFIIRMIL